MLPTETELRERYASYSNNGLLYIIHNKSEYTSHALEVAHALLADRNISATDIDAFHDEQEDQKMMALVLSRVSLTFWEKSLFFFIWIAPLFRLVPLESRQNAASLLLRLKRSQAFSLGGFVSMILIAIAEIFFNMGVIPAIFALLICFVVFIWLEKQFVYELTI